MMRKPKEKIPVYNIASLAARPLHPGDFMVEAFGAYLGRQSPHLHHPHRHTFYHLVCFTGGKGSHSIDFTPFPVEAGQIYFMTPGQVHSWNFDAPPEGYVINFSDAFLHGFLADGNYLDRFPFFSGDAADSVVPLASPLREKVGALLGEMNEGYRAEANPDLLRVQLVELFLLVQSGVTARRPGVAPGIGQLRKLIEEHYKTMRRPGEYARMMHITADHLNAMCREILGRTAGEVIRDRVLLEAKRLLTNADATVAQIADELNFQDNSYFNRFFKRCEGMTPDEFRRKHITRYAAPLPG